MNEFVIAIRDINSLTATEVAEIYGRLSRSDSGSTGSIRKELEKRYTAPVAGAHPEMALALVWHAGVLVAWVGTRPWPERFKGEKITAQTVECFTDPTARQRGYALLGLQALITAGVLDKEKPVAAYNKLAVRLATRCGCKIVLLCAP